MTRRPTIAPALAAVLLAAVLLAAAPAAGWAQPAGGAWRVGDRAEVRSRDAWVPTTVLEVGDGPAGQVKVQFGTYPDGTPNVQWVSAGLLRRPGAGAQAAAPAQGALAPAVTAARPAAPAAAAPAAVEQPPAPRFVNGRPVGLYYMQRRRIVGGGLEQTIWYFAPNGRVYEDIATGVSAAELAAHKAGSQGTVSVAGDQMTVTWGGGYQPTTTSIERGPEGFYWNMGSYLAIPPFRDPRAIAGRYAGGTSVTFGGTSTAVQKTLTLRPDGTFTWDGISSTTGDGYRAGGQGGSAGTWAASAYALTLRASDGTVTRAFAFPFDDARTPAYPDRLFFAGVMYTRQ